MTLEARRVERDRVPVEQRIAALAAAAAPEGEDTP